MRRSWWTAVAVAGLLVGALGTGAASAGAPAPTTFLIAVVADGSPPVAGVPTHFSTALDSEGQPVAGAAVDLIGRAHGSSTYATLGSTTTGPDGTAAVRAVLTRTTVLRWRFAGSTEHAATTSEPLLTVVAARVRAHVGDSVVPRPRKVVVGGRAGPDKVGQRVSLWIGQIPYPLSHGPAPRRIANAVVREDGSFRLTRTFRYAGTKRLFVKVNHGRGTAEGYSGYLRIQVR